MSGAAPNVRIFAVDEEGREIPGALPERMGVLDRLLRGEATTGGPPRLDREAAADRLAPELAPARDAGLIRDPSDPRREDPLEVFAEADHGLALRVCGSDGLAGHEAWYYVREGVCVAERWDGERGAEVFRPGEPVLAQGVLDLAIRLANPREGSIPRGEPCRIPLDLARAGSAPGAAAAVLAGGRSLTLVKVDFVEGGGRASVMFLEREGAWYRLAVDAAADALEIAPITTAALRRELHDWVVAHGKACASRRLQPHRGPSQH